MFTQLYQQDRVFNNPYNLYVRKREIESVIGLSAVAVAVAATTDLFSPLLATDQLAIFGLSLYVTNAGSYTLAWEGLGGLTFYLPANVYVPLPLEGKVWFASAQNKKLQLTNSSGGASNVSAIGFGYIYRGI